MSDIVSSPIPLGFPWPGSDPFIFIVHHLDAYPAGNEELGPDATLEGRALGSDFTTKDGWRMYHGRVVPGFPEHPHRGFETITVARQGYVDHSDSLGATARFGAGDVQWMTAGKGIVHAEMFPLIDRNGPNTLEMFQIWLNLPREDKLVDPYFTMLWNDSIPEHVAHDDAGRQTVVRINAGRIADAIAPPPPPNSWASRPDAHVALWTITMAPDASWTLPAAPPDLSRMLYFFSGDSIQIGDRKLSDHAAVQVRSDADVTLVNGPATSELLFLQARPIDEPIVQHGPFVMNTRAEIQQAITDYGRTRYGGWPWPSAAPVHERDAGRFAKHANGANETPQR